MRSHRWESSTQRRPRSAAHCELQLASVQRDDTLTGRRSPPCDDRHRWLWCFSRVGRGEEGDLLKACEVIEVSCFPWAPHSLPSEEGREAYQRPLVFLLSASSCCPSSACSLWERGWLHVEFHLCLSRCLHFTKHWEVFIPFTIPMANFQGMWKEPGGFFFLITSPDWKKCKSRAWETC
jgi:hypothetical protein